MRKRKVDKIEAPSLFPGLLTHPKEEETGRAPRRPRWFSAQRTASAVKTKIVVDFFRAWANVMKNRSNKLGYFDFFSGPGVYDDGTKSTPLQIMRIILGDERLRNVTMTLFEDKEPSAADSLSRALVELSEYRTLRHTPNISHGESTRRKIQEIFKKKSLIPTFMFLDPFGYAGLTRDLIRAILKDWGCEVAFYFNFNRINAALRNHRVREHMDALFGKEHVDLVRTKLSGIRDEALRENIVVGEMREVLYEVGARHVLVFRFRKEHGGLDHHLIFATKNLDPAQRIMKDIMSAASSFIDSDGIGNFEFDPCVAENELSFLDGTAMDNLKKSLMDAFHTRTLTVAEIYALHNERTPFTIKNGVVA